MRARGWNLFGRRHSGFEKALGRGRACCRCSSIEATRGRPLLTALFVFSLLPRAPPFALSTGDGTLDDVSPLHHTAPRPPPAVPQQVPYPQQAPQCRCRPFRTRAAGWRLPTNWQHWPSNGGVPTREGTPPWEGQCDRHDAHVVGGRLHPLHTVKNAVFAARREEKQASVLSPHTRLLRWIFPP